MRLKTSLAVLLSALALVGCNFKAVPDPSVSSRDTEWMAQMPQAPVDPLFARYEIDDPTGEPPGTIVVKQKERQLYYVLPNKRAMRYGVAVGDEAYGWTGNATVQRKAEWPNWNPPAEMKARWPHVRATAGGPNNPLGARALYLYDEKGRDTLYRIHGTNEPDKIGQAVSSGCIRMRNIDVIDLYNRVEPGTRVVVL
ncbi:MULTISPECIES: L,D-transpeptidase [unclassified Chelatococcus]|uniref:L,D-transpeptidase n=1 Tax=unclassified Chelatococcus TaxID=2638111 RepID=UPI001BCFE48F|nr:MULTISPECIES: L,D-transpeptidase [unclassified Chelatococcus]MBS7698332.1 L,D-transpeptidase [Chelatococcus sp. YT9]MBX3559189.1 L,D-transpeptidase [Chelatococcus sp.]